MSAHSDAVMARRILIMEAIAPIGLPQGITLAVVEAILPLMAELALASTLMKEEAKRGSTAAWVVLDRDLAASMEKDEELPAIAVHSLWAKKEAAELQATMLNKGSQDWVVKRWEVQP